MRQPRGRALWILITLAALAATLQAQVPPQRPADLAAKSFRHPGLTAEDVFSAPGELPTKAAVDVAGRLDALGIAKSSARLDARSGRFATLLPATPLIPGDGVGNRLTWADLEIAEPKSASAHEEMAWQALLAYLEANQPTLKVDPGELTTTPSLASHDGDMVQIHAPRQIDGIEVRGSHVSAVVKMGNLILFGAHKWSDRGTRSNRPWISAEEARTAAEIYLDPWQVTREWGKPERTYLTLANGNAPGHSQGYRYQAAWAVKVDVAGDGGSWEVLVDAYTGEILSTEDKNAYAEAKGGVYPKTNDGVGADGTEQPGWPMPFMNVGSATTDTGGNYNLTGSQTATFFGPYVNMADNCGTDSLTQAGGIDWGSSGGTDCTTPGFGGAGNTHSSRSGFYELNRIKEMARSHLPSNTWLQGRLTSNMNINNTCNAFWNGSTVNFYRSGGGCANTGEIAAVFDHEWGHGMDANDVVGGIASPSGEGIADIYSALRLYDSCIGRNFLSSVCSGNGDPCLTCTGVRDIDYLQRQSGNPHTYTWSNANCGGSVHCVGGVYSEAVWSLWKRKLQSAPYNYDNNTAAEIVTRLSYIGAGATSTWFSGGPPNGGCGAGSGYMNYLAADDDDGNLNNGTPHMTAIYQAFNDQQIACGTPTVQDSGCAGVPTAPPNVSASPGNQQIGLSWGAVSGASSYDVFRAEGIFACDFGKVKIGSTAGTSFNDTGLQNGRDYSYVVIPKSGASCFGPASACDTTQPADGPECAVDADCDDGLFCNGAETCNAGSCVAGSDPCPGQGCDEGGDLCTDTNGPQNAVWNATYQAPACLVAGSSCDSLALVDGRANLGPEPNQPNTIADACADGTSGTYHSDESNDKIVVSTLDSQDFSEGATVRIDATVYAWSTGSSDTLDLFYAADASSPSWTLITSIVPPTGGIQTLSAQYTLPAGALQAVRTQFRYQGSATACASGAYNDRDDLVFAVGGGAPECTVDADCSDGLFCNGAETCNAGSCQAGAAPDCDDGVSCTVDSCNEGTDSCDHAANDGLCDNGLFCDGAETCSATLDCQAGSAPDCNDGVSCTVDSCNEGTDSCNNVPNDGLCDDGAFCNGAETCNAVLDCQAGSAPCGPFGCDEAGDVCLECAVDADCDDGAFCNGAETCAAGICQAGSDPCPGQSCDEGGDVCSAQNGPQDAVWNTTYQAPACLVAGSECDSLTLVNGRAGLGPEPNQPNTVADSCADGTSGTYHSDESNDKIVVKTLDGADMTEGATVRIDATVWAWSTGSSDTLDLYYAADAANPSWVYLTSIVPPAGGAQTLSAQYVLPAGSLQAVRAQFRYQGSASACTSGSYNDRDDLVFAVGGGAPECTVDADCDDGLFCNGSETCSAGSCQAGSDPCPGESCDEGGDVCVPGGGCAVDDDFEAGAPGWVNDAASTCTTGAYVTGNPTNPGGGRQIVGSHSGVTSIFTATNTSAGVNDVDGGNCILGSPTWAVSSASTLSVWYWHGQRDAGDDPAGDFFRLEYSTNGGSSWTTLRSIGDSTSTAAWTNATASVPAGSSVKLRVQCSDGAGAGDLVECGIDDVSICNP